MQFDPNPLAVLGIQAILIVLWYLLRQKDAAQEKEIASLRAENKLLWEKHDADVQRLADLELKVASGYYQKHELDARLERMEQAVEKGLERLAEKVDRIAEMLVEKGAH